MRNEGKEVWEGYCIDFVKKLSEEMQFDYDLVIPEDQEFGKKLPNGEWTGVIGDLAKGVYTSLIFKNKICVYLHTFEVDKVECVFFLFNFNIDINLQREIEKIFEN